MAPGFQTRDQNNDGHDSIYIFMGKKESVFLFFFIRPSRNEHNFVFLLFITHFDLFSNINHIFLCPHFSNIATKLYWEDLFGTELKEVPFPANQA